MKTASTVILGLYFSVLYSESIILPGTNYCGAGELEQKGDPLYAGTDNCCQQHDYCPEKIYKFSKKFELRNYYPYTISLCQCDEAFRSCLKEDGSQMSATLGQMYFNVLRTPCFELKEAEICKQKTFWLWGRCIKEEKGLKAELKYARKF
mgnify:FL=1